MQPYEKANACGCDPTVSILTKLLNVQYIVHRPLQVPPYTKGTQTEWTVLGIIF